MVISSGAWSSGPACAGRTAKAEPGADAGPAAARSGAALVRNVARLVKPPEHTPRERDTRTKAEVRKFLAKASTGRLYNAWRLSLYGVRRGEVLGLRWSDIDLRARTLTVNQARVLVEYRIRIEEPKSRNGKRTLPLDGELVAAMTARRKRQLEESTIAGPAYGSAVAELDWYQCGEYVITDQAGTPVHRVVLRRVPPFAQAGRAAEDHPARFPPHDPDAHGARGRADLDHQQVGRSLRLGVHAEDLRPRERRRPATRPGRARQNSQDRLGL
jgi:integrase